MRTKDVKEYSRILYSFIIIGSTVKRIEQLDYLERTTSVMHEQFNFVMLELLLPIIPRYLKIWVTIYITFFEEIIQCST